MYSVISDEGEPCEVADAGAQITSVIAVIRVNVMMLISASVDSWISTTGVDHTEMYE